MGILNKITGNYDEQAKILGELRQAQGKFEQRSWRPGRRRQQPAARWTPVDTEANARQPALILGGWDPDQAADQTLQAARDVLRRLDVQLNADDLFVPGLRRGYAILPIKARPFESEEAKRGRVQQAIQRVRNANITTGTTDTGGMRKLWIALSQSPERTKRAKLAGKVKRTILELGGDPKAMEVEFATGTVWMGGHKVSSAAAEKPKDAEKAGAGWVDVPFLSRSRSEMCRQCGSSAKRSCNDWADPHAQFHELWGADRSSTLRLATWNVGGLAAQNALEVTHHFACARHGVARNHGGAWGAVS